MFEQKVLIDGVSTKQNWRKGTRQLYRGTVQHAGTVASAQLKGKRPDVFKNMRTRGAGEH
jgi:hypothetical protein